MLLIKAKTQILYSLSRKFINVCLIYMSIRDIKLTVGNQTKDYGILKSYPVYDGKDYKMPIYTLTIAGTSDAGKAQSKDFSIFRFGIHKPTEKAAASVVGLANKQTHVIKKFKHDYQLHSVDSAENGAWVVWKTFYIHDGADDPRTEAYGTIGCVEVVDESESFVKFNDFIITLSGSTKATRNKKLIEIGASGKMSITYLKAARPPLIVQKP